MTSILTNHTAIAALQTLRTIGASMQQSQAQVSTGLRIQTATDNAAYWSISTTMKSDNKATAAVVDALGLGAAKVDTAYTGMSAVVDIMHQFKARLVAATEDGVDKTKIQEELEQLKRQIQEIARSSSFSGQNWLNTDVPDIYDNDNNKVSVIGGFTRSGDGVTVDRMNIHLSKVSLFNSTGGGLLEADARNVGTAGGLRTWGYNNGLDWVEAWKKEIVYDGEEAQSEFAFSGPLVFDDPSDVIRFTVTVDADDPLTGFQPPLKTGNSTTIEIDRAFLDAFRPGWNGVIGTNIRYAEVLNHLLAGAGAWVDGDLPKWIGPNSYIHDPVRMKIYTSEDRGLGLTGSYVRISNIMSTVGDPGVWEGQEDYGIRARHFMDFEPFQLYEDGDNKDGVQIDFNFSINGQPATHHSFDRTYVNTLLGKETGKVETAEEMATLMQSILEQDWDVVVEATPGGEVNIRSNPLTDRLSGSATSTSISDVVVSIEPVATMNLLDVDIVQNPELLGEYIYYVDVATTKVIAGASVLGALQMRIGMQTEFVQQSMAKLDQGVGRLVDADMDEASTRLKALQTQEQLAIQALSIANANAEHMLQLFR
nr:flagellin [Rhizobium sp. Khangiran2]